MFAFFLVLGSVVIILTRSRYFAFIQSFWIVIVVLIGCGAAIFGSQDESTETLPLSAEVEAYEPVIRKYAKQYGIPDYVPLIQAVMMQESGGRGNDPMQASECGYNTQYPRTPGGITDPEYSISAGIQNLADCFSFT